MARRKQKYFWAFFQDSISDLEPNKQQRQWRFLRFQKPEAAAGQRLLPLILVTLLFSVHTIAAASSDGNGV